MTTTPTATRPDWPRQVAESLRQNGVWFTYQKLLEARRAYPEDLAVRGYLEILRGVLVRDFLAHPKGVRAIPRLGADFLSNFERFNLNAQEGYLVSLIDGRTEIQKLMILSPFDPFHTLFILAKLTHERAITVPQ
jgi:hypothetical protein